MNKGIRFLGSMKLALVLFTLLILLSALATFIPQNKTGEFYSELFSPAAAKIIIALHLHQFFRSAGFLLPLGLFFLNLCICSVRRIIKRRRVRAPVRLGPDVIHLAVMLLILFGAGSLFIRNEGRVLLGAGQFFDLPNGKTIKVIGMEYLTWENGYPKDWLTKVRVLEENRVLQTYTIEVNKPLSLGSYKIYQHNFVQDGKIILQDPDGSRVALGVGEGFHLGTREYVLSAFEETGDFLQARFILRDGGTTKTMRIGQGEKLAGFIVEEILSYRRTGLLVTWNPLFPYILAALLLFALGMALTFYQKIRDTRGEDET